MSNPPFPLGLGRLLRLLGYARKSDQDDGVSIEAQCKWISEMVQEFGGQLAHPIFCDRAKRGWDTASREEFQRMLEVCRAEHQADQPLDGILCWHTDRFSRADSQETSWFIWEYRKIGMDRLYTQNHGWLDFARPETRVIFGIEQEMTNHAYSRNLSQNVLRGKLEAAQAGRHQGDIPYGYVLIARPSPAKSGRLALADAALVEMVRWIFRRYLGPGVTVRGLCRELMEKGVPSPRGKPTWHPLVLRRVLSNPAYLGRSVWNRRPKGQYGRVVGFKVELHDRPRIGRGKETINPVEQIVDRPGDHEAIIDQDTFDQVQIKLAQSLRGRQRQPGFYPLSGLLTCGHCSKAMSGIRPAKEGARRYYYCTNYSNPLRPCHWNGIPADTLLRTVVRRLQTTVFVAAHIRQALGRIRARALRLVKAKPEQAQQLDRQWETLKAQSDRAAQRYVDEKNPKLWAKLKGQFEAIEAKLAEVAIQREALAAVKDQSLADLEALGERAIQAGGNLEDWITRGELRKLREFLDTVVENIELIFSHERTGKKEHCRFARGVIHFQEAFRPLVAALAAESLEFTDLGEGSTIQMEIPSTACVVFLSEHLDAARLPSR